MPKALQHVLVHQENRSTATDLVAREVQMKLIFADTYICVPSFRLTTSIAANQNVVPVLSEFGQ